MAKAIQICGTGSGVGKSVMAAALCRIFYRDGHKICPFKAQNMALNSYVTKDGAEIGRAQAVQAQAACIAPTADMNPILIKPSSDRKGQVIILGKPVENMSVYHYVEYKKKARSIACRAFDRLAKNYKTIVIEGAGSPAEINLKEHDIVNMAMAKYAKAPVILVADIDKGGVFASLVGTLELLTHDERLMVKGFIINKFRGDKRLLRPGLTFLEKKTGIKVLGVIPYFKDIRIPEEDSVPLDDYRNETKKDAVLDIATIYLPHISNFTDFDPLGRERDVRLRYIKEADELGSPDVIIIPGTKNTIFDLSYLKKSGLAVKILDHVKTGTMVIGICGGYQMLGKTIRDCKRVESSRSSVRGLGLLPITTDFKKSKVLTQVVGQELGSGLKVTGYEIHHGLTRLGEGCSPVFRLAGKGANNGARTKTGNIWGTYLHGVFDQAQFRRNFLNLLRAKKGLKPLANEDSFDTDREFDKLAQLVRKNIDMKSLYRIMNSYA